ncbi:olfactory receptor 4F3/4F16/4F29-like [Monodelphis domestica]|uniref:olfactory receptor 4F3/4F16/4F29-like n=1 Tax=Monodelphis domestica TaxID=13616 RepID=UPI0024E2116B|nr:olfactory receptor 4F3/4F16/4F29-like [Monodelphis domestica]
MDLRNQSIVSEFVLMGFTNSWVIQLFLFVFSSVLFLAIILGNSLIVLMVAFDSHLQSPMYFFLAQLSFIDMIDSCMVTPKMLADIFRKHKLISFGGCVSQIFFIHAVGATEMVLLLAMAFDRYIAICKPLHYLTIMNLRVCISIVVTSWMIGISHSFLQLAFVIKLPFCGPNKIDSFYCDLPRFIRLACTDTYKLQFLVTANSGFISLGAFFILIISYFVILISVRQHSSGGSAKALSTLSAHIAVVILFFGPCIFNYVWPFPRWPVDKYLALFDSIITPFLNPIIYTLRNKDMKVVMKKVLDLMRLRFMRLTRSQIIS